MTCFCHDCPDFEWISPATVLDFFVVPTESGFHVSFSSVSGVECFVGFFFDLECFVSFAGSSAAAPCSNLKDAASMSDKCISVFKCDVVSTA